MYPATLSWIGSGHKHTSRLRRQARPKTPDVTPKRQGSMTADHLTVILAERVMGWGVGPDRFSTGKGSWKSRWRFQPTCNLEDAFLLLEKVAPEEYSMRGGDQGTFEARVRIDGRRGEASGVQKARTITFAIARALGIEVEP